MIFGDFLELVAGLEPATSNTFLTKKHRFPLENRYFLELVAGLEPATC